MAQTQPAKASTSDISQQFSCYDQQPTIGSDLWLIGDENRCLEALGRALLDDAAKKASVHDLAVDLLARFVPKSITNCHRVHVANSIPASAVGVDHVALVVPLLRGSNLRQRLWKSPVLHDMLKRIDHRDVVGQRVTIIVAVMDRQNRHESTTETSIDKAFRAVSVLVCDDSDTSRQLVAEMLWRRTKLGCGELGCSPLAVASLRR